MPKKPFQTFGFGLAAVIAIGVSAASPAKADGLVDFDIGDSHFCIGLISCLFKSAESKTRDHRDQDRDHRDQSSEDRENTVVVIKPEVRDHRDKIIVRDHRTETAGIVVRDHRVQIRDHRQ